MPTKTEQHVRAQCKCGTIREIRSWSVKSGRTKSCGCLLKSLTWVRVFKHGDYKTPLYKVWSTMRQRCSNPNRKEFERYGGKGITVCQEWQDYPTFKSWALATGYQPGLSIERKNARSNYCPENCEWLTVGENSRRTTSNRDAEIDRLRQENSELRARLLAYGN